MVVTFLALGSNLGDRENFLRRALDEMEGFGIHVERCSSLYETEPKGVRDQPWFLNAAVKATTSLTPRALLATCLAIEHRHARVRTGEKAPRTLDLDILFYGDSIVQEPGLSIPHPALSQRKFVLEPLVEIAPDWIDPVSGKSVRILLDESDDPAEVRRLGSLK